MPMLLAGLSSVPWDQISHAYGPATDVPDLLRTLVDPAQATDAITKSAKHYKHEVSRHVQWLLWGNVFHQGTRWQVTPHVVPFLVEILRDGPPVERRQAFLLGYLHHLALGYPSDLFPALVDTKALPSTAPDEDPDTDRSFAHYAWTSFKAVQAALPTLAPFAAHPNEEVARKAIALLGSFRDPIATDALRAAARARTDRLQVTAVRSRLQPDKPRTRKRRRSPDPR